MDSLVETLLDNAPAAVRERSGSIVGLERRIRARVESATRAWPGVSLDPEAFVKGIALRLPEDLPATEGMELLHTDDLYLALACGDGSSSAISTFESTFEGAIARAAKGASASMRDEFEQLLRDKLFVAESRKIADYSARGSLQGWVRVTAKRTYLDLVRGIDRKREVPVDDGVLLENAPEDDPELAFLKQHYREEFRTAFGEAMGTLTPRERNVLRQHLVHQLAIDDIGRLYEIHRATAARWIAKAKQAVLLATRERLAARLNVEATELESIMRLIESRIEVSLTRHLRD